MKNLYDKILNTIIVIICFLIFVDMMLFAVIFAKVIQLIFPLLFKFLVLLFCVFIIILAMYAFYNLGEEIIN